MKLLVLGQRYKVWRLQPNEADKASIAKLSEVLLASSSVGQSGEDIFSITKTKDEVSVVASENLVDSILGGKKVEEGWRAFKVCGPLDFGLVGILADLTSVLARAKICVFTVSTYDTDYILVKDDKLEPAVVALTEYGHSILNSPVTGAQPVAKGGKGETCDDVVAGFRPFGVERYFAKYEFSAPCLLCCSDCNPLTLKELLSFSDDESLQLWNNLSLGYTESKGLPLLREEIINMYNSERLGLLNAVESSVGVEKLEVEDALVVCPIEGIYLTARALLQADDEIIVVSPSYQSLFEVARSIGCDIKEWKYKMVEGNNSELEVSFDVGDLEKLFSSKTKLVVVNFPHNPTGAILSMQDWINLVNLCRKNGCYLFSDEMYRGLEHKGHPTLPSASQIYENAITLSGVSKTLGLPGLRIGWLLTRSKKVMQRIGQLKDYTTICSSAPSEVLAVMGIRQRQRLIESNLALIQSNYEALQDFVSKHKSRFVLSTLQAGSTVYLNLLNEDAYDFAERVANEAGTMLLPSKVFSDSSADNHLRIGLGRKNVPLILDRLDKYLSQL
mmetsp:Transcript_114/g.148  ORF Transcript_114/g.148 Transcript_114/m.148 type:complete len:559 (-) Transcript_114:37-1713(-)